MKTLNIFLNEASSDGLPSNIKNLGRDVNTAMNKWRLAIEKTDSKIGKEAKKLLTDYFTRSDIINLKLVKLLGK